MSVLRNEVFVTAILSISLFVASTNIVEATYIRTNKMFDIPQTHRPEWGSQWCAPTAVGNSFAWLAKGYGLDGLVKVNGTGAPLSAADVINILGVVDMGTIPNPTPAGSGTKRQLLKKQKRTT